MKNYIITLLSAIILFFSFTTFSNAEIFYDYSYGQWNVVGIDDGDPRCIANTHWTDGSYVALVVDTSTAYVEIRNADWYFSSGGFGEVYFDFNGKRYSSVNIYNFEVTTVDTITVYDIDWNFVEAWALAREVEVIMPTNIPNIRMGLNGTQRLYSELHNCVELL